MNILSKTRILFFCIFLLAAFFRFYNINWDQNFHLHPDERFLTMVAIEMKMPNSVTDYLNPLVSKFNPANVGFKFFVYGMFPVIINKLLAIFLLVDTYNSFTLLGRILAAISDLLTLWILYKMLQLLRKHYKIPQEIVYLGIFFYAIAVLPIQLSHFFAVDIFLNLFIFASMFFALKYYYEELLVDVFVSGIFFAFAIASKISAIYASPLIAFLVFITCIKKSQISITKKLKIHGNIIQFLKIFLLSSFLFIIAFYIALRFADPYYFNDGNILNIQPNKIFLENIKTLQVWGSKDAMYPPSVQWVHKPAVIFSLYNIAIFGLGIFYFCFLLFGIYILFKKYRKVEIIAIIIWVLLFFLYQSTQFDKVMRYFIFLYPFFALFAGFGFYYLTHKFGRKLQIILIGILLFWPFCYLSVYVYPTTRVAASKWIYQNIKPGSYILNEHWDDPLPLPMPNGRKYPGDLLPVFDPDTPEKWEKMNALLAQGNYMILSSNRTWGSIPTVPERYPLTTEYYRKLLAGESQYKKIKEFTSYPSLHYLGIPFQFVDDWADESFTVYEHPKVMIFKKI